MPETKTQENKVKCRYCGKEFFPQGIKAHEQACEKNPGNDKGNLKEVKAKASGGMKVINH